MSQLPMAIDNSYFDNGKVVVFIERLVKTATENKISKYSIVFDFLIDPRSKNNFIARTNLSFNDNSMLEVSEVTFEIFFFWGGGIIKFPASNSCECIDCRDSSINHKGIYFVQKKDVKRYVDKYNPTEIGWNKKVISINPSNYFNFGESKGLEFDHVLIYPTNNMVEWLKNHNYTLKNEARAKLYVGITRARYSVGIIVENFDDEKILERLSEKQRDKNAKYSFKK